MAKYFDVSHPLAYSSDQYRTARSAFVGALDAACQLPLKCVLGDTEVVCETLVAHEERVTSGGMSWTLECAPRTIIRTHDNGVDLFARVPVSLCRSFLLACKAEGKAVELESTKYVRFQDAFGKYTKGADCRVYRVFERAANV